ncbi:MAG: hypothetical protein AAF206_32215, partial [Bacteroidota bacterium]
MALEVQDKSFFRRPPPRPFPFIHQLVVLFISRKTITYAAYSLPIPIGFCFYFLDNNSTIILGLLGIPAYLLLMLETIRNYTIVALFKQGVITNGKLMDSEEHRGWQRGGGWKYSIKETYTYQPGDGKTYRLEQQLTKLSESEMKGYHEMERSDHIIFLPDKPQIGKI